MSVELHPPVDYFAELALEFVEVVPQLVSSRVDMLLDLF